MSITVTLISKLASMMLYVVVGYFVVKTGVLKAEDSRPLSTLIIQVLQPCLILNSYQLEVSPEKLKGFLACIVFSTLVYFLWIFLTTVFRKPFALNPVDQASLIYSNVGNLVLPLVSMVLGEEMVFYASAVQIPFNLLLWTHGYQVIRGQKGFHLKNVITNSNVIAILAGLLMITLKIRIPDIPLTAIRGFAGMVGPASMMVIGMVITQRDLKKVFTYKKAYAIAFGRLLLFPMIGLGALYASGFLRAYPQYAPVLMVTMFGLSAPPSTTVSQISVVYDVFPVECSIYNVLSTFLCILTMPLVIACYQLMFL